MKPCKTPNCPNPRLPKRRICHDCNRQRQNAQHRARVSSINRARGVARKWPACKDCTFLPKCRDERLWLNGPLPCETLLDWEIEAEYDTDSSPSYYVIPLPVRFGVEA